MTRINLFNILILTAMLAVTQSASAQDIVLDVSGQVVERIENYSIMGVLFNVEFRDDVLDETFFGDQSGATATANDFNSLFNGTTAAFVRIANSGASKKIYSIYSSDVPAFDPFASGVTLDSNFVPGNWQIIDSSSAFDNVNPVFTRAIPEPTTATLGLIGLAGLVARRRRAA